MEWIDVRDRLPDSEVCVLIACVDANEPVWIGYGDGNEQWRLPDGMPADGLVTHWSDLPESPKQ